MSVRRTEMTERELKLDEIRNGILDCEDKVANAKAAFEAGDFAKVQRELTSLGQDAAYHANEMQEVTGGNV